MLSQGLVYATTPSSSGSTPYWDESACYELTLAEVEHLERVTEELHELCLEAAHHLASGALGTLGLPAGALELARENLLSRPPSLYGRFDFSWDGTGEPTLLEYNADTPTGLLEAAVVQWNWLQDTRPDRDQWNSLHERLIAAWRAMEHRLAPGAVHFASHPDDASGEETMTVAYLLDTAQQAGLRTVGMSIADIGWETERACFVDLAGEPIRTCFKLYPWEDMLAEDFGRHVEAIPRSAYATRWLEPPWKVLLSNKALLAALWQLNPGHPNLVPAYLHGPRELTDWVAKPLHGREGASIRVHAAGQDTATPGPYGAEGYVYQQWAPLADFDGNRPVLGSWIVGSQAAGLGIRESDGPITDDLARFVPHYLDAAVPDAAQQAAWLAQESPSARA